MTSVEICFQLSPFQRILLESNEVSFSFSLSPSDDRCGDQPHYSLSNAKSRTTIGDGSQTSPSQCCSLLWQVFSIPLLVLPSGRLFVLFFTFIFMPFCHSLWTLIIAAVIDLKFRLKTCFKQAADEYNDIAINLVVGSECTILSFRFRESSSREDMRIILNNTIIHESEKVK